MQTQMKHYVPRKSSREPTQGTNESRVNTISNASFYDARPEGVSHAD